MPYSNLEAARTATDPSSPIADALRATLEVFEVLQMETEDLMRRVEPVRYNPPAPQATVGGPGTPVRSSGSEVLNAINALQDRIMALSQIVRNAILSLQV